VSGSTSTERDLPLTMSVIPGTVTSLSACPSGIVLPLEFTAGGA
jgi:hypothetical protein